jgi:hypothetical protein
MNCLDCQEQLQRLLDGDGPNVSTADLDLHLSVCSSCRELHAAGQRLLEGVRFLRCPVPPAGLAQRINQQLQVRQRRLRFVHRFLLPTAVAASLLVATMAGYFALRPAPAPKWTEIADRGFGLPPVPPPSFNQHVEEAGLAVVSLTRRTAGETIEQGRLLLPRIFTGRSAPQAQFIQPVLQPPAESLREIKESMSIGLEPVTTAARRALDLLLREQTESGRKRGL